MSLTGAAPLTVRAYRSDLLAFIDWAERLGLVGPEPITRTTLRRYVAHLTTRGYARGAPSPARRRPCAGTSGGWPAPAESSSDPSAGLSAPGGGGRLPRVLRDDELSALLDDPRPAGGDDSPAIRSRDDAVLELLYGSGLRVSELCALRPADIDLDRRRVVVWGKGSKQRVVPLSAPTVEALRDWLGHGRRQLATADTPPTRCSSAAVVDRSDPATCAASSTVGRRLRLTRMPCATPSPLIFSMVVPTYVRCRSFSVTPTSVRRSTTLTSASNAFGPSSTRLTPERRDRRGRRTGSTDTAPLGHLQVHRAPADRDRLILVYAPLVKYVASRVAVGLPRTSSRATSSATACSG